MLRHIFDNLGRSQIDFLLIFEKGHSEEDRLVGKKGFSIDEVDEMLEIAF
jgi:hypothetical protein